MEQTGLLPIDNNVGYNTQLAIYKILEGQTPFFVKAVHDP